MHGALSISKAGCFECELIVEMLCLVHGVVEYFEVGVEFPGKGDEVMKIFEEGRPGEGLVHLVVHSCIGEENGEVYFAQNSVRVVVGRSRWFGVGHAGGMRGRSRLCLGERRLGFQDTIVLPALYSWSKLAEWRNCAGVIHSFSDDGNPFHFTR